MSSRRTLILIGALVAGALAALLIFQYVGGIEEKAQGDAQLVNVVIAKGAINKGDAADTLIANQLVDIGQRRQIDLPSNAVARPEEIKGQIAQLSLQPGTVITSDMFQSDAVITNSVSQALPDDRVAVTASFDAVHSVAGLVTQGDYVNLSVILPCQKNGETWEPIVGAATGTGGGEGGGAEAQTGECWASLYQKVKIIGIGRSLGTGVSAPVATPGDTTPGTTIAPTSDLITFEVTPEAAQDISAASGMYMSLVRKDYVPRPLPLTPIGTTPGVTGAMPYPVDPEAKTAGE